jgi:Flp pilus assembly protein TadG
MYDRAANPVEKAPSRPAPRSRRYACQKPRRGIVIVISAFLMVAMLGFVAFTVDTGQIIVTKTKMQGAVDAAALAASQEIVSVIYDAGAGQGDASDVNSIGVAAARARAQQVAEANDVYINASQDVQFGKRTYNEATEQWTIAWGDEPYNVVKVTARRDQDDTSQPDGKLPMAFAWVLGKESAKVTASAIAFVEARDIIVVLDYSGSMNDDSELKSIDDIAQQDIEDNLQDIYEELGSPNIGNMSWAPDGVTVEGQPASGPVPHISVKFGYNSIYVESTKDLSNVVLKYSNGSKQKYDNLDSNPSLTGTFSGTGSNSGKEIIRAWIKSGNNASGDGPGYGEKFRYPNDSAVKIALGLNNVPYPYNSGSWDSYIDYAQTSGYIRDAGYRKLYGGLTWTNYLLQQKPRSGQTSDLWKTPHYPFHSMKQGMSLFLDFLTDLNFGDNVGLVTYASEARREEALDNMGDGETADLAGVLITDDYAAIDVIQRHKQAAHYSSSTALGDGIKVARELLAEQARAGARPVIFVMTDGNANVKPDGWSMPGGWDWSEVTDFDGNGTADYTTSDSKKQYAFYQAKKAIDQGYMLHTLTVGQNADRSLMGALAQSSGGVWIDVPGGSSIEDMTAEMKAAFREIAGKVPPPRLVHE